MTAGKVGRWALLALGAERLVSGACLLADVRRLRQDKSKPDGGRLGRTELRVQPGGVCRWSGGCLGVEWLSL